MNRKVIYVTTAVLPWAFFVLIIIMLPDSFPVKLSLDTIAWEVLANVRYYVARCVFSNPDFIFFPFSHPFYTIFSGSFFTLLKELAPWKQMLIYNFTITYTVAIIIFLMLKDYFPDYRYSIPISLLLFLQPAIVLWLASGFAYHTGLFILAMGTYFFYVREKSWGIIFFSLLPLIRHELGAFLIAPFISLIRKRDFKLLLLLILPFVTYYAIIPLIRYHNIFYYWFFHELYNGTKISLKLYLTKGIHALFPFYYYNPLIWIGLLGYLTNTRLSVKLRPLALNSLILLFIAYLGRIIMPVFFFSLIGLGIIISGITKDSQKKLAIMSILISQIIYLSLVKVKPGPLENTLPFRNYPITYNWLIDNYNGYDYFIPLHDKIYVLWEDRSCRLATKFVYPGGHCNDREGGIAITTPRGYYDNHRCLKALADTGTILLEDKRDMWNNFTKFLIINLKWNLIRTIDEEQVVIIGKMR